MTTSGQQKSTFGSFQSINSLSSFDLTIDNASTLGDILENQLGVAKRSFGQGSDRPVIWDLAGIVY